MGKKEKNLCSLIYKHGENSFVPFPYSISLFSLMQTFFLFLSSLLFFFSEFRDLEKSSNYPTEHFTDFEALKL